MKYDNILRCKALEKHLSKIIDNEYLLNFLDSDQRKTEFIVNGNDYIALFRSYCESIYSLMEDHKKDEAIEGNKKYNLFYLCDSDDYSINAIYIGNSEDDSKFEEFAKENDEAYINAANAVIKQFRRLVSEYPHTNPSCSNNRNTALRYLIFVQYFYIIHRNMDVTADQISVFESYKDDLSKAEAFVLRAIALESLLSTASCFFWVDELGTPVHIRNLFNFEKVYL